MIPGASPLKAKFELLSLIIFTIGVISLWVELAWTSKNPAPSFLIPRFTPAVTCWSWESRVAFRSLGRVKMPCRSLIFDR